MLLFTNIRYVLSRLMLASALIFTLFAILPYEHLSAHNMYLTLAIVLWVCFAALTVAGKIIGKHHLKKGGVAGDLNHAKGKSITGFLALTVFALIVVLPFYVMFVSSIKTPGEAGNVEFTWWPKQGVTFDAYERIFTERFFNAITVFEAFLNTLWVSVWPTIVTVLVSAISAYAFAKLEFKLKKQLFGLLLLTMMVPGCVTLTSSYLLFDAIDWTRTYLPLIVPSFFGGAGIVFFMRQYFAGIPDDLLGSAKIDGLGTIGIFFQIVVPVTIPAFTAQLVLTFVGRYNDYMGPLLYLYYPEDFTQQLVLSTFNGSLMTEPVNPALVAAACMFSIVPLLVIYFLLNKVIISGISMSSGLKG